MLKQNKQGLILWIAIILAVAVIIKGATLRTSSVYASKESVYTISVPNPIPEVSTLEEIRHVRDGWVIFKADKGNEPTVTFTKSWSNGRIIAPWFIIEDHRASVGLKIGVSDGMLMPDSLDTGDKITYMKGKLETRQTGRILQLAIQPSFVNGKPKDISHAIYVKAKSLDPKTSSHNYDGVMVKVIGTAKGYHKDSSFEWFFLDDNTNIRSEQGYTGIEVFRPLSEIDPCVQFPIKDGALVEVEGLCVYRELEGIGNMPQLRICFDCKNVSNQVRFLK